MATDTLPNETIAANWQAAWAAYASAKAASDEYERAVFMPAYAKIEAAIHGRPLSIQERHRLEVEAVPDWDAINEKIEELNEITYGEREWALLLTPAPDRDALEWKIKLLFDADVDGCSSCWRMDGINAFLADVRRLLNH